jgi:hypothetical protein
MRIFDKAAHGAVRSRFGGDASDGTVAFDFYRQAVKFLETRAEQKRPC